MSESVLSLLTSDDPIKRKQGIGAAAKSTDKRYLKLLAEIYKTDPDTELRTLAKKAGVYINKNQPQPVAMPVAPAVPAPSVDDEMLSLRDDILANLPAEDELYEPAPAPATPTARSLAPSMDDLLPPDDLPSADDLLSLSNEPGAPVELNPQKAQYHYGAAMDAHVREDDARAVLELGTAFRLNPDYGTNPTAVALAAELTGKPDNEAVAIISNPANWEALTERHGGIKTAGERSVFAGFALWIAAAITTLVIIGVVFTFLQSDLFEESLAVFFEDTVGSFLGEGGFLSDE